MQTIDVSLKKDYLPIDLKDEDSGEVKGQLRFYYDDKTLKNYQETEDEMLEDIKKEADKKGADEDAVLAYWFNYTFGDGAYEIVKNCQQSIINRRSLLIDLTNVITLALFEMKKQQDEKEAAFYKVSK